MKKFLTCTALAAFALTSCSSDENVPAGADKLIRLGADVITTKAPVNDLAALSAVGTQVGLYAVSTPWTSTALMQNVQTTGIDATSGDISWTGTYNYPTDGSNLTFYAYHPYAAEGTSGSNFVTASDGIAAPVLNFTIDGTQDVMYATPVTANKTTESVGKLTFAHVLTQLHFLAKKGSVAEGTTVKSITLKNTNSKCTMNIADGTLGTWTTPATLSALTNGTFEIPQTETAIGGTVPLMVQPGQSQMLIDVVTVKDGTEKTFENILIKPEGENKTFEAGVSYAITLTFNSEVSQTPVQIAAGVTPWQESGKGSGTVE